MTPDGHADYDDYAGYDFYLDGEAYECRDGWGTLHPEHDYGEIDCRRCGAEPES